MSPDLDYQAEMLVGKIRHYLITTMGRTSDEANADEFYRAFSYALREEVMINWLATAQTQAHKDVRTIYYLSMEYLPGRMLSNNISNLNSVDLVKLVLQKMNRSLVEIISRESDLGLGNGGLGRLASCFLESLATNYYPARGYGLRYQYGTFEQQIWDGVQIEAPDCWLIHENPWEFRRDLRKVSVRYCGLVTPGTNIHGDPIHFLHDFEEVWALPYDYPIIGYSKDQKFSVVTMRLWTTKESPHNFQLQRYNAGRLDQAAENSTLTDVLYPSDHHQTGKRVRLKQEFLLVSASLQDIIRHYLEIHDNFRAFSDKVRIQINDTHPAMVIPELIRLLTKKYDLPWKTAVDITQTVTGFTNHTVLAEALEEWDQNLFFYLLPRQQKIIERLNFDFLSVVRSKFPSDEDRVRRMSILENGKIRMANLAIIGAHKVNGVAELHSNILKSRVFKDFYELWPDRFTNVTNGVTQRRWLAHCNPKLATFVNKRIGDGWVTDFSKMAELAKYASDPASQQEFLEIKKFNKQRFIQFMKSRHRLRNQSGEEIDETPLISSDSLFDVQVKRMHEYKRQLLNALHILMLYDEILENPDPKRVKRTHIFGGKAAPGYEAAKNIIRLINCISRKVNNDPAVHDLLKVVFVENYNVSRAEVIIPAADLSEQISTAGTEASGTGNMKLSMNGALTIGTDDGANIEMAQSATDEWWPFTFGLKADQVEQLKKAGTYNPWDICANNPKIKRAVDRLRDGSLAQNDQEHQVLTAIYDTLLEGHYGQVPDRYMVLQDLTDYARVQKLADQLYLQPNRWAEFAIHNIAAMGPFSSDVSIKNYAEKIWNIEPCPLDESILARIRHEYSEHDRCRIFPR
ncbi:MAG: glycogen/starch/alpha-glucan phosphorylase [Chlamydiales bacterium]|nr:glycogen/starch/alpha-glucan phosphorylase [Chlamydiales bacterium]